jgi:peptidoglycan/LPS O-acetylase OafA/YrhL
VTSGPSKTEAKSHLPVHVPELDGVRGFAIAIVMALHFVCSQIGDAQTKVEYVLARLTGYGSWGVDLFFVLSGFLITGILYDTRGSGDYFKKFYVRRTLRIFPLYYATLLVVLVLIPTGVLARFAPEALQLRQEQAWLWTYLTNVRVALGGGFGLPYVSHFWTLAVEEHFYLVWPFVVGLLPRRTVLVISVVASVAALGARIAIGYLGPNPFYAHVLTPCRLDSLCIGAFCALVVRGPLGFSGFAPIARRGAVLAAAGVLATSVWHMLRGEDPAAEPLRETLLALLFGFTIVLAAWPGGPTPLKSALRARWLRFLGKYSYGLYVFHGILAYAFGAHQTLPFFVGLAGGSRLLGVLLQALFGTVVSLLVAVASYEWFEARFLRLKERFSPSGTRAPATGAVASGSRSGA